MPDVKILNPWDSQGNQITDDDGVYHCVRGCGGAGYQQGYVLQKVFCMDARNSNTVQEKSNGGRSLNYTPNVIYPQDNVKCLNPWDSQGNRISDSNGVFQCVRSGKYSGYPQGYILQRAFSNEQEDRVYVIDCQGGKGSANYAVNITPSILSDSHGTPHATAYAVDLYNGEMGGVFATLNANSCASANHAGPAVCFRKHDGNSVDGEAQMFENHAHDSRYTGPLTVSQTVSQLFGTGGNNTPLIVEVKV